VTNEEPDLATGRFKWWTSGWPGAGCNAGVPPFHIQMT
jgi:hypothetical protein